MLADTVHGIMLGTVDGDPGVEIAMHIHVASKAAWDHIGGDAPQFMEGPADQAASRPVDQTDPSGAGHS